ncbi:MAG: UDP-2,3-diacylglucosamine diphosphatase [Campylobacterota bacterium]|nr:UDP-2,3-diacylglucosamine diphosphatase [Campylobacterota bacterium]
MKLNDNTIFISDSHYNSTRTILFTLLNKIELKEISTTQLFLMGDIFDFLSNDILYFKKINQDIIDLINKLSNDIEIIYLEGNHDFNLKDIFPNVFVISRENQPISIKNDKKTISLAHGDIFTPFGYNLYTLFIRNSYIQKFLNIIDINNWLSKKIEKNLKSKNICKKQKDFQYFINQRIKNYNIDLVIEGHFHQGIITDNYINLPALCCTNEYMIYQNKQFKFNMV